MIIIIGTMDNRMREFIKNHKFHNKIVVAYKICNIKHIKASCEVIIPFGYIMNNDLISNTYIQLYELLLTLDIKKIYYYNEYNIERLKSLANEFNVEVIKKYNE